LEVIKKLKNFISLHEDVAEGKNTSNFDQHLQSFTVYTTGLTPESVICPSGPGTFAG